MSREEKIETMQTTWTTSDLCRAFWLGIIVACFIVGGCVGW
jgi:hypothetical protein